MQQSCRTTSLFLVPPRHDEAPGIGALRADMRAVLRDGRACRALEDFAEHALAVLRDAATEAAGRPNDARWRHAVTAIDGFVRRAREHGVTQHDGLVRLDAFVRENGDAVDQR